MTRRNPIAWAARPWLAALAATAAATALHAGAATPPTPSMYDSRIKTVVYNPRDVVPIKFRVGESILVQFEADEVIDSQASGLGMGDAEAWSLSVRGNNIFFKPKAPAASTNMVVVTNKRRYAFDLIEIRPPVNKKGQVLGPEESSTFILDFVYPDSIARAEEKRLAADELARKLDAAKKPQGPFNTDYWMFGDVALAPTEARDNGRFTYFRYATSRELPAIFKVLPDGSESLVNRHMEGDTVVIHETARRFHLRLGTAVLAIENDGYSPDGQTDETGTTLPGFLRVLKGKGTTK